MDVMSLRLSEQEQKYIVKWAKQEKTDKSQAARELIDYGWKFALLECYREGKISLELLAKELGMTVSESMDFVAAHGISLKLDYDDYCQSLEALRKAF